MAQGNKGFASLMTSGSEFGSRGTTSAEIGLSRFAR